MREFRALWLADAQSLAGDQLARVALSVLVFQRTGSAAVTALVYGLTYLPAFLGGILLSGLADRIPPRRVMIFCDLFRAAAFAAMAIPGLGLPALSALLVLAVIVGSPFSAAENTMLPQILDGDAYVVGSGLRMITGQTAQLAGFAGGGIAIALIGPQWGLAADAVSFAVSAVIIRWAILPRPAAGRGGGTALEYLQSVGTAARVIRHDPQLRTLLGLGWLAAFFVAPEGLAAPYANAIGGGEVAIGLLLAAIPAGNAIGVFVFVRWVPESRRPRWTGPLAALAGVALIGCAWQPGLPLSLGLWFLCGVLCAYQVQAAADFVRGTPADRRGQVFGLAASGLIAVQGIGVLVFGLVAQRVGPQAAVAIAGAVAATLAVTLMALRRSTVDAGSALDEASTEQGRPEDSPVSPKA